MFNNNIIVKIFIIIDYFGIQFNFLQRDKFNTIFGGIAFIVFIFITILFYIIYSLI